MVWALTGWPPTPSTSAAMLAALIRLFPKHNLWIWRWARALNFFGWLWRGLFWVEPVLLNCCMVLATVLQLSFRVLAVFLKPTSFLCRATLLFFRSSESSLSWGAMLNFQWPVCYQVAKWLLGQGSATRKLASRMRLFHPSAVAPWSVGVQYAGEVSRHLIQPKLLPCTFSMSNVLKDRFSLANVSKS